MDTQKFTEKSLSALENAHSDAVRRKNSELSTLHLLHALAFQEKVLYQEYSKNWNLIRQSSLSQ